MKINNKAIKIIGSIVVSILIYAIPTPDGLPPDAWLYFSIFIGVVIGLILEPIPPAFIGLIGICVAVLCKVGPVSINGDISAGSAISWGLSGFSNSTVWLIFAAFMIGIGYQNTGLGKRIALILVRTLGKSTLGLGYAISIADGILAPFIPSNAARSGGVLYPIISSIPPMFGSYPDKDSRKIGAFLTWCALSATCVSSSIFLTGQAPNPLALEVAKASGVEVVSWGGWFLAFLPVSIILFILTPLLTYFIYPPEIKKSPEVVTWAEEEHARIGKIKVKEIILILISIFALVLWVGSSLFEINATTTAIIVIIAMVATNVISWDDFLGNKPAWNVLVWFSTLVALAGGLKNVGFLAWLGHIAEIYISGYSVMAAMLTLVILYYVVHYFFASTTAHVTALLALFITIAQLVPGMDVKLVTLLMILPMGIMGVLTPYGTGHSPVWFASGYVKGSEFWKMGFIFGFTYLAIYLLVGIPWITKVVYNQIF
ncbi:DASS family sodium-coupled anion symporter [Providencia sneebia]|uniref:Citrate:succinate antiporter n=1 Tax=Providencia sneebia DSM 19967 TaxID=1141660 RepID=K8WC56_9GAMM|nr:DASS family sodium-coupled anion symporter [Providencia sneebia]EKT57461.1 citrate:succinate antiporter [Providencia sneebia DSM 19967]